MSIANEMIERTRQTLREQSNEPVECAQCGLAAEPDWKGFARVKVRSNREPEVFCGGCTRILEERFNLLMDKQADALGRLHDEHERKRAIVLERYQFDTFDFEDLEGETNPNDESSRRDWLQSGVKR